MLKQLKNMIMMIKIELDKKVNFSNLIYRYNNKSPNEEFDKYDNALNLIDKIRKDEIGLAGAKNDQAIFKSHLGEIKRGNKKNIKSKEQKNVKYNADMLCKARNEAIKFFDDYFSMVSEAKIKATKGRGLKILTPKQMLQRLPIALAQIKAGNNSENLLNETREIVYSLYQ